jgi:hypothetical protein
MAERWRQCADKFTRESLQQTTIRRRVTENANLIGLVWRTPNLRLAAAAHAQRAGPQLRRDSPRWEIFAAPRNRTPQGRLAM